MVSTDVDEELKRLSANGPQTIPAAVRFRIDRTLENLPVRTHRRAARRWTIGAAAASLCAITVLGSGYLSPVMASALKQLPVIESVFQKMGDWGLKTADEKHVNVLAGQKITKSGVTITLKEVLYDGARLAIGFTLDGNGAVRAIWSAAAFMNGEMAETATRTIDTRDGSIVPGIMQVNLTRKELPETFDLRLKLVVAGMDNEPFEFNVPINQTVKPYAAFVPNVTKAYRGISMTASGVKITPSSAQIVLDVKHPDELGPINYEVLDDRGNRLAVTDCVCGSGGIDNDNFLTGVSTITTEAPLSIPHSLTIRPYTQWDQGEINAVMEQAPTPDKPFIIGQGEAGRLFVTAIDYLPNKTLVHYTAEGDQPKENGKILAVRNYRSFTNLEDSDTNRFVLELPAVQSDEKLDFVTLAFTHPTYYPDLEMTVPLQ
ncbi:DUF4179 domain-containing protein [Paenibacillus sp. MBLB4367]|uniref:DUF4179 domain-containing protein n=1 Tax=Paenibacillus sp. MBLB4367 TaxID=3384767 RepID=UPI0039083C84